MTRWDKILIISVLIVSIIGTIFVAVVGINNDQKYVVIKVEDKIVKKISIEESKKRQKR